MSEPQVPCCRNCGAPIEPLRWTGHYLALIDGRHCAYCRQPHPASDLYWADEDRCRIEIENMSLKPQPRGPDWRLMAFGIRVGMS